MGQIKSSAISAGSAISELVGVDTSNAQNQQVEFSYTTGIAVLRSEERRVGKECRSRWSPYH